MAEDSASWYARKLAQARGPPAVQQRAVPQYQQPVQGYQQNPQYQQQPAQAPNAETLSELLAMQEHGEGPRKGKGAKLNPDPCPNCGGALFFHDLGRKSRGPAPAPHCFTCGYNDMFEQGLESTWQGGS